jgi:hypothetical protein
MTWAKNSGGGEEQVILKNLCQINTLGKRSGKAKVEVRYDNTMLSSEINPLVTACNSGPSTGLGVAMARAKPSFVLVFFYINKFIIKALQKVWNVPEHYNIQNALLKRLHLESGWPRKMARRTDCVSATYVCESPFTAENHTNPKHRSRLIDVHTDYRLRA